MSSPPGWAKALIERLVRPSLREAVLVDLERLFQDRVEAEGERAARRWYRGQAVRTLLAGGPGGFMPAHLLVDLRHAWRALRRAPGPVLLSVLSLSLGIAATATMISVVDAIDFRPLPYRDADRLVQLTQVSTRRADAIDGPVSRGLFREWQDRARSYEALAAASPVVVVLGDDDRPLEAARVSGDFFPALGVTARLGRTLTGEEVREGARALVISHDLWQGRFGGDRDVIGRPITVSWAGEFRSVAAETSRIVGVLPPAARYPRGSEVWLPASGGFGGARLDPMLSVLGRLQPGVSIGAARAELETISRRLATEHPDAWGNLAGAVSTLRDGIRTRADRRGTSARFLLLSVAGFILVLTTVNAATVFLVRAARQKQDLVVRAALGAPRSRLLTLMLGQSLIVSTVSGALGVLLSSWGIRLADARLSVSAAGLAPVLDGRVVAAGLFLSLLAGLAVGLLPISRLGSMELHGGLQSRAAEGTGTATGGAGGRLRGALIVAQVASALVLLSGAGVLARDFVDLVSRDPGFDADRLLVADLPLTTTLPGALETAGRVARISGIESVAVGGLPAEGYTYRRDDGETLPRDERPYSYRASPGYFRTLGVPLLAGRPFSPGERTGSTPVAIVNRTAARQLWPGARPVGRRLFMGTSAGDGEWVTIVGVSDDERVDRDLKSPITPVLYRPWGQLTSERRRARIFARTAGDPGALVPEVRALLEENRGGEGWQGGGNAGPGQGREPAGARRESARRHPQHPHDRQRRPEGKRHRPGSFIHVVGGRLAISRLAKVCLAALVVSAGSPGSRVDTADVVISDTMIVDGTGDEAPASTPRPPPGWRGTWP